jgi:Mlc titration factor MtfA (ptsG expression regulator)
MFGIIQHRRQKLKAQPFPEAWAGILRQNAPFYQRLAPADQRELEGHIQVFLAEKKFEGCDGLRITDEIRVTIAAHACLLLLHQDTDYYPLLVSILVYPHHFVLPYYQRGPAGVVEEGHTDHLGLSWREGIVILAWDEVKHRACDIHDGRNVVFHEFAHQLDAEDGSSNGAPVLPRRSMYVAWARILGRDYAELVRDAEAGRPSFLDTYGATNPAEFFAVATEFFFEAPRQLRASHPELYDELKLYYRQDPAGR